MSQNNNRPTSPFSSPPTSLVNLDRNFGSVSLPFPAGMLDRLWRGSPPAMFARTTTSAPADSSNTEEDPEIPQTSLTSERLLAMAAEQGLPGSEIGRFDPPTVVFDNVANPEHRTAADYTPVGLPSLTSRTQGGTSDIVSSESMPNVELTGQTDIGDWGTVSSGSSISGHTSSLSNQNITLNEEIETEPAANTEQSAATTGLEIRCPSLLTARNEEHIEEDYPSPEVIISDALMAAQLANEELQMEIRSIPFSQVRLLGDMRLPDVLNAVILSPSMQVALAYGMRYYSSVPDIGYSITALKMMHYYRRINSSRGTTIPDITIAPYYQEISSIGLDHLILTAARVFISDTASNSADLLSAETHMSLMNVIDKIRNLSPYMYLIYNLLGQIIHGSLSNISPIPEIMQNNPALSMYIDAIASGTADLSTLVVSILPRSSTTTYAPYQVRSATRSLQPTLPDHRANNPPSTMPQFQAPGSRSAGPVRSTSLGPESSSLLSQGDPGRTQIIRDTSAFRQSIREDLDLRNDVLALTEKVNSLEETVQKLAETLTNIDRAFATVVTQQSQQDLSARYALNTTLLSSQNPDVSGIMSSAPVSVPPSATRLHHVTAAIEGFPANGLAASVLLAQLREVLNNTPHMNLAENLTEATLKRATAKSRLVIALKQIPRM